MALMVDMVTVGLLC